MKNFNRGESSRIILELNQINPNWRDTFINSPLKSDKELYQFVLEVLNNNIILHFITIYLLIMLIIIFLSKLVLNNTNFNFLNNYPLGKYFSYIL